MNLNKPRSDDHDRPRYMPLKTEDSDGPQEDPNPAQYHYPTSSKKPWKLAVILLGMGNVFLMGFIVSQWSKINIFSPEINYSNNGPIPKSDILMFCSTLTPLRLYAFKDDDRFRNLDTLDKVESAWVAIFPQGNGFVHLPNPSKYNLSPNPGVPINSVLQSSPNAYIISAFHQLHCLMLLQRFHVTMLTAHMSDNNNFTTVDGNGNLQKTPLLTDDETNHAEHCFIYLRQGVLCSGDTTLEQPDTDGLHVGHNPLHGWGTEHVCRNWEVLAAWAEENAAF